MSEKMANEKRLICANDPLKQLSEHMEKLHCSTDYIDGVYRGMEIAESYIKNAPTVDAVEVVHGRWEYGRWEQGRWVKGNERCRCSVCHRDFAVDNLNVWHGCPQCLAKMDGGNEDG